VSKRSRSQRRPNKPSETISDFDIAGRGDFHLERMDDGHVWLCLGGKTYDLYSRAPIYLVPAAPEKVQ
jgi:hypothetical protein